MTEEPKDREHELRDEVIEAAFRGDMELATGFSQTLKQFQEEHPKEDDGKYRVVMGDGVVRRTEPGDFLCADCKRTIHYGGGIAFYEEGALGPGDKPMPSTRELTLAIHHSEDCARPAYRWHRFKRDHLGGHWAERKRHKGSRSGRIEKILANVWYHVVFMGHWKKSKGDS